MRRTTPAPELLLHVAAALLPSGCVVVGDNSRSGWSIWPGGPGILMVVAFALFALRFLFRR